eukprot:NODE_724_length_4780_cov_0.259346.p1 type:complete len:502 gc:universal NODE_724_length_4780_cov_0.259346:1367-2872(+)
MKFPSLSANELKLTKILLYVKNTDIRFAGGWVRDKLLGISSHDIDVVLDGMTGNDFVNKLKIELSRHGEESNLISHVGKIVMNPDQSKHLETITGVVCGFECDFVNLRSESYAEHSRIPEMDHGTPAEDASRRDFTINSLFYNLNTGAVEDFTGTGIKDLKEGIIRTPIDPKITFLDDPLRAVRAVRFASKLKFKICPEVITACHDPEIQAALLNKVSNERIVIELNKMLSSPFFDYGLYMLHNTLLYDTIFDSSFTIKLKDNSKKRPFLIERQSTSQIISHSRLLAINLNSSIFPIKITKAQSRILNLGILYTPYSTSLSSIPNTQGITAFADNFTTRSLKFSKKDNFSAILLLFNALKIRSEIFDSKHQFSKAEFGLFIREFSCDGSFELPLLLAAVLHMHEHFKTRFELEKMSFVDEFSRIQLSETTEIIAACQQMIKDWDFGNICNWAPLLNGKDVMELKGVKGRMVGTELEKIIKYQIENHPITAETLREWYVHNK